jgi:N-acetylglucosamine-6-phosphate deacetylase
MQLCRCILKMNEAVKKGSLLKGCDLDCPVQLSSANAAKKLDVFDSKGSLSEGKMRILSF